jgi:shikimate dehydrogenase
VSKYPEMDPEYFHFGLVGFPLGHSLSPRLHQAAFKELGLLGDYALFPIPFDSKQKVRFDEVIARLRNGELTGINITIPYKQTIISLIDELTQVAQATGAVNTVFLQDDHLLGDNTDVAGFSLDLLDYGLDYMANPGNALVLGAGGAARAVIYALVNAGWKITISTRRFSQAEMLSRDIQNHLRTFTLLPIIQSRTGLDWLTDDYDLIVNTTPLGMAPNSNTSPWPQDVKFPSRGLVYDLVYNPQETVFLHQARLAGLATRNGLGMLARQAATAFERWTGVVAPFEAMWNALADFRNQS